MLELLAVIACTLACQVVNWLTGVSLRQAWPYLAIGMVFGAVTAVRP